MENTNTRKAFLLKLDRDMYEEVIKEADGRPVSLWIRRALSEKLDNIKKLNNRINEQIN